MREQKHTPGPWKYADAKIPLSGKRNEIRNGQGYLIAYINIGMSDYVANAELIAQAPDLLAKVSEQETLLVKYRDAAEVLSNHLNTEQHLVQVYKKQAECAQAKVSKQEKEIAELKRLIASDSVYTLLRYGVKNPSHSGVDECEEERLYYDLYNISNELRKKS